MNLEDFWREYVGEEAPAAFMRRMGGRSPGACVDVFMRRLPSVFGLPLRQSWAKTFGAEEQHTRTLVRNCLVAYLDELRADWEPVVQDLPEKPGPPAAETAPEPEAVAAPEAAAEAGTPGEAKGSTEATDSQEPQEQPQELQAVSVP